MAQDGNGSGLVPNQLASLVPPFDPATDKVDIWTGKVELLVSVWPKDKFNELATRLILACKGSAYQKLQLKKDTILDGTKKGIQILVETVGGVWGQIPVEQKFELTERALFKCIQKSDETSDSYIARSDVVWSELLLKGLDMEELQAYIVLRGARLGPDDKKRVLVEAGAEKKGKLKIDRVVSAIRMLGSKFFGEMIDQKRDKTQKVYDHNAFLTSEEPEDDQETYMMDDVYNEEEMIETLAAENDEDANTVLAFEEAVVDSVQSDPELATQHT